MLIAFDAHCHIAAATDSESIRVGGPGGVILAGRLLCGVSPDDWGAVERTAGAAPTIIPAFGLHPWEIAAAPDDWAATLADKLTAVPRAWLGEAGLDRVRQGLPPLARQAEVLSLQLNLARDLDRPASLHCVRAWEDILPLLDREYLSGKPRPFVMHAFAGPETYVKALTERGAFFTIGTALLRHNFRRQRECAAAIPGDRLLVESDAFVAGPEDGTGDLAAVLTELAAVREVPLDELAASILDNSRRLFLDA